MRVRDLLLALCGFVLAGAVCAAPVERKVYAHYMGCCPAGHAAIPYWFSQAAVQIAKTNDLHASVGGSYENWPLMPYNPRIDYGMESNAGLDPVADPDGDGFTNLQEYENGTHPLLADTPYRAGETWDFADVLA